MRLIDADALEKTVIPFVTHGGAKFIALGSVRTAPTIEAAPVRHGRWEWRGGIPWCSNCGEMPPGYSYEGDVNTSLYCPNCGAKMDKEADNV